MYPLKKYIESLMEADISAATKPDVRYLFSSVQRQVLRNPAHPTSAFIPAYASLQSNSSGLGFNPCDKQRRQVYKYSKNIMRRYTGKMQI